MPKSLWRVRLSFSKESIARDAMCQHAGTLGQSSSLLPWPADGEEALCKIRCNSLFRWQSHPEQVTFTSVPASPQLTPSPHCTKTGDQSLAQLPHKSLSAPRTFTGITTTTSPSVTVNVNMQLQRAEYHDLCHVRSQKRCVSLHSSNAMHLYYQLYLI